MLFFKKCRKKIGVCLAMLGVLCCTVFGLCRMKGTSTVTAKADDTSYVLSGTWTFNDVLVLNINSDIDFIFYVRNVNPTWTSYYTIAVSSDNQTLSYWDWTVNPYSTENGWYADYCKTIYILGGQTVDEQFYNWFTANAYPVSVSSAGGGTGGGYTQEDLDQAFQDGVNSVDTNAIRQEGYNAGYQAGLSAGSGTTEEVLQAEYERGYQAGIASIDQSAIRQEGYDEGYSAGLQEGSGVSEEVLQAEYERGYQAGYESGYGEGVADSVAEGDYGVFIGSSWTYQAYDSLSQPPVFEQLEVPFEDILKEGSKLFFNSTTLSAELNAIAPLYWNQTHVRIDFAVPVIKGGLLLGFDTSQLPVHFSIKANGYDVKLVDNSVNPELSSRYVLDFSNVPDGTFINNLSIYLRSGQGNKDRDWVFSSTALVTDVNLYGLGYNNGYNAGKDISYEEGFEEGEKSGYDDGYEVGKGDGYNLGYNTAVDDSHATAEGFFTLVTSVVDAPVQVFIDLLDFELLGYNMKKFALSVLTACLLIAVIKLFSGFGFKGD